VDDSRRQRPRAWYKSPHPPHTLDNVIEVALRRIPITPDLNPNLVVRHPTSFRHRIVLPDFHSILADAFRWSLPLRQTCDTSASFVLKTARGLKSN
jgi:hypothetical protein